MTKYEVQDETRQAVSTHRSESAAIKAARKIEDSRVVMHVTSGTYKSTTCIYPAVGTTYSN
jgi:pectin methylesterase-like acyl-CoA thioesterase